MAVKYKRDPGAKFEWNVRGRSVETTRKRTLLIYGGLGVMFVAIFLLEQMSGNVAKWGEPEKGKASVVRKIVQGEDRDRPAYSIECEMTVPVTNTEGEDRSVVLREVVRVGTDSWEVVEEGDEIHVVYRVNEDHSRIRIDEISLGMTVRLVQ